MGKHAFGTKLLQGVTEVAKLTSIGGLDISADTIDVTVLNSPDGYREFIQGLRDAGEVSFSGFFKADDSGQNGLLTALNNGAVQGYTIEFPITIGAEWTFDAIVTGFVTGAELEDAVSFEGTLKLTGKPSLGVTASTGISALSLTGAGTLSPTFDIDKFVYSYTHASSTVGIDSFTAVDHTLTLFVDGVKQSNLLGEIAFASGESKLFEIVAKEAGKTSKKYTIAVAKA